MAVKPFSVTTPVETITIGATPDKGGTRSHVIKLGGQTTMPFLPKRGKIPNSPVVAYEIWDVPPAGWPSTLSGTLGAVTSDPVTWGNHLVNKCGAKLLCLRLMSFHPDRSAREPKEAEELVKRFLHEIKAPVIITGCGVEEVDRKVLPLTARASAGERILLGNATDVFYRELTDACAEFGHNLITESPIDINIAKQVNILVSEAGLPPDRVVMYATTGALGYGLEYAYSIMEKTRLSGLEGDRFMNRPQVAFVGQETWKTKEASKGERAGIQWEAVTAQAYLHAGADLVVIRHPETGKIVERALVS